MKEAAAPVHTGARSLILGITLSVLAVFPVPSFFYLPLIVVRRSAIYIIWNKSLKFVDPSGVVHVDTKRKG